MAQSIRVSDDLYCMAQNASLALSRSLAQQIEHWARLGAALDAAGISTSDAMKLLGHGRSADELVSIALQSAVSDDGGLLMLKDRQRKDAVEVTSGERSARSLLMFQKGDLQGYSFDTNPKSEFVRGGDGW